MALKHAPKVETVETPEPTTTVAPETAVETTETETNGTTKERSPWTPEKVRVVKQYVREHPGITFDALLTALRGGELAEHLAGASGRQRLLNLISNVRKAEEKGVAEGKEFTPLPEIIMPVSMARPDLLAD